MIENVQIKASTLLIPKDVVILARCRKFFPEPEEEIKYSLYILHETFDFLTYLVPKGIIS